MSASNFTIDVEYTNNPTLPEDLDFQYMVEYVEYNRVGSELLGHPMTKEQAFVAEFFYIVSKRPNGYDRGYDLYKTFKELDPSRSVEEFSYTVHSGLDVPSIPADEIYTQMTENQPPELVELAHTLYQVYEIWSDQDNPQRYPQALEKFNDLKKQGEIPADLMASYKEDQYYTSD